MNSWMTVGISNITISVYVVIDYVRLFYGTVSKSEAARCIILSVLFIHFSTWLFYGIEANYRKLYFIRKEIKKQEQKWKYVLNCLPVGVVLTDHLNNVEFINEEIKRGDLLTNAVEISSNINFQGIISQSIADMLATEHFQMKHKQSNNIYEMTMKQLNSWKVSVIKDQTVYQQSIREKMMEKYLRMLISSISHEIRNPLNAIEGYTTFISDLVPSMEVTGMVEKVHCAAKQISFIVDSACYLIMIEGSKVPIQPENFNPVLSIQCLIDVIKYQSEKVSIAVTTAGNIPRLFKSDEKKYVLILFHLLSNSLKYTKEGYIKISVSFDPTTSMLYTEVTDTGCGIPREKIPTLFDLYDNVHNANAYNPQGMGLGLALCKKLVKILGGNIHATSILGQGTSFTFCMKYFGGEPIESESSPEDTPGTLRWSSYEQMNILKIRTTPKSITRRCDCPQALVVDDVLTSRLILKKYLETYTSEVNEAENGLEAVNSVANMTKSDCCKRYRVIFMDINMPIMDGTTAVGIIKKFFKQHEYARAPIVAVTAANFNSEEETKALLSLGFDQICMP